MRAVGVLTVLFSTPAMALTVGTYSYMEQVAVKCPNLRGDTAILSHLDAEKPKGTAAFFSGGYGTENYAKNAAEMVWLQSLVDDGYNVIQVHWTSDWWSGFDHLVEQACRPATVIAFILDRYGPVTLVGQSGGASQVAYAVEHYGQEPPKVVLSGGPPEPMNILETNPPLYHPQTTFRLFAGELDTKQRPTVEAYFEALANAGTAASYEVVPGTPHRVQSTVAGQDMLKAAIEGN